MINLKTYFYIFIVFFFLGFFSTRAFSHEWNGDDWAKRQYAFAQHVVYSTMILNRLDSLSKNILQIII